MLKIVIIAILAVQLAESQFQSFGQSFSSSSFTGPNGEVVLNSIYTDSDGNRVINGVNQANPGSIAKNTNNVVQTTARTTARTTDKTDIKSRPGWETKPLNSGAYVPDDRGKYKGN